MPKSLLPATMPDITKLMDAKAVLVQLRDHIQTPDGAARVPDGAKPLEDALEFVELVIKHYYQATLVPAKT